MKLKLKNFRCHTDREFDLDNKGLVLISGSSGRGKTSIFMAIMYALYGKGQKLATIGTKLFQVELELENYCIVRKNAKRLIVYDTITKEEYIDDAAQGVIDRHFNLLEYISYVEQNISESFVLMSPARKLEFLESLAFKNVDLYGYKKGANSLISQRSVELTDVCASLRTVKEHFLTLTQPEKVFFPIKTKDKELAENVTRKKYEKSVANLTQMEIFLKKLQKELVDLGMLNAKLEGKDELIESLTEQLDSLVLEKKTTSYEGDEVLLQYEEKLLVVQSQKELILKQTRYEEDKQRYEDMKQGEIDRLNAEIGQKTACLWSEYSQEDVDSIITENQATLVDMERLHALKSSITRYLVNEKKLEENKTKLKEVEDNLDTKKDILAKLILQQDVYECPACSTSLKFMGGKLEEFTVQNNFEEISIPPLQEEIDSLTKICNRLRYTIPEEIRKLEHYKDIEKEMRDIENKYEEPYSIQELKTDIDDLKEYRRAQQEMEKIIKKLEASAKGGNFSPILEKFRLELNKQKDEVKALQIKVKRTATTDIDENKLVRDIEIQKTNRKKIAECTKGINKIEKDLNSNTEQVKHLKQNHEKEYSRITDVVSLGKTVGETEKKLSGGKEKIKKYEQRLKKIENYKRYKEALDQYNERKDKIESLQKQEIQCREDHAAAMKLKDKIAQAESIAMTTIINHINVCVQSYLDLFFQDNISVKLSPFKTTLKGPDKPQINMEVEYKNMQTDIRMLSGGELSRVNLAFTLALADLFNSPFLMLDECLASLDEETVGIVIDAIRENCSDKLCLIVAHQCVSGVFDREIHL